MQVDMYYTEDFPNESNSTNFTSEEVMKKVTLAATQECKRRTSNEFYYANIVESTSTCVATPKSNGRYLRINCQATFRCIK